MQRLEKISLIAVKMTIFSFQQAVHNLVLLIVFVTNNIKLSIVQKTKYQSLKNLFLDVLRKEFVFALRGLHGCKSV
jgi:hypothetical protein